MKRILSILVAAAFAAISISFALPVSASGAAPAYSTPAGYNDHDYQLLVSFLEIFDINGVKNGEKLAEAMGKVYDPTDPSTWTEIFYEDEPLEYGVVWNDFGSAGKRVVEIYFQDLSLIGGLDVSGCEKLGGIYSDHCRIESVYAADCPELNSVSMINGYLVDAFFPNCTNLRWVELYKNKLTFVDFSGCSRLYTLNIEKNVLPSIDVSDSPELGWFCCARNCLTSLDLTHNGDLYYVDCSHNDLAALDVTHNPELTGITACCNRIASIDLTHNPLLEILDLRENALTSIDLSACPELGFETIAAEGRGTVSAAYGWVEDLNSTADEEEYVLLYCAIASPDDGAEFLGWYTEDGAFLGSDPELGGDACANTNAVARFTEGELIPGDADGDGAVTAADALIVLRAALGLHGVSSAVENACDMDHNGSLTLVDALLILRLAIGLISL